MLEHLWETAIPVILILLYIYFRRKLKDAKTAPTELSSNEVVCQKFDHIRTKSQCTYAHTARAYGGPNWITSLSLEENLVLIVPFLEHFVSISRKERIDGFIIEITDPAYGKDDEVVANTVLRVVKFFGQLRYQKQGFGQKSLQSFNSYIESKAVNQKKWCDYGITVGRERLFITPFAPCYTEKSSRYSFGEETSTFLLLQASWSFDLLTEKAGGDWQMIIRLRDKIRENFAKHGRPYADFTPHTQK